MHLSFAFVATTLLLAAPSLAWLPNHCLPCALLCKYNKQGCEKANCFREKPGGVSSLYGLSISWVQYEICWLTRAGCGHFHMQSRHSQKVC
ncbi:hypothetical protein C7974DRAFT_392587 [Boeremia exigua]|uniref:uncharacterized protein n=1 Tax=Boeremia exigua TaxID=749465 RepID=UPI001E8E8D2E|nr:uncharacterized protein C7974DRAFT_392587 [Boeremia exigua]KAH6633348.1 hypothetical protein C7974DRAFT_392587 [Boeremia exigua]